MPTQGAREPEWASPIMRTLEEDIACAIDSDSSVMISGESGAGKKFVAHAIHQRSRRRFSPFVVASVSDITDPHDASRPRVETARPLEEWVSTATDNGTLLLDEIEKITPMLQLELLCFMEGDITRGSRLRLMTAASPDVFARVRTDQFPSDLFYRLNVLHLKIPALRDRPDDIQVLFQHYLDVYARAHPPRLSTASWQRLVAYPWPGNVTELKTTAETLAMQDLARRIEPDDLPAHLTLERWPRAPDS